MARHGKRARSLEEEELYSSTLKAVRKAFDLVGIRRAQGDAIVYYLV